MILAFNNLEEPPRPFLPRTAKRLTPALIEEKFDPVLQVFPPIILPTETCSRGSNLTDMQPPSPVLPSETIDNQMPIASKQRENLKHKVALFIVRALAERNLTQKALDGIVHDMKSLVEVLIREIQAKLTDLRVEFSLTDMDANIVRPFTVATAPAGGSGSGGRHKRAQQGVAATYSYIYTNYDNNYIYILLTANAT